MKTLFAFMAALVLIAVVERPVQAAHNVPVDVFYEALAPYGDWVEVEGSGYCFRPTVSLEDADWRPYTEGSWIYTDAGWTWDSEEPFGWAAYHYGRWFLLGGTWLWQPGAEWGPAWVSWRTSDEYIGWAPLPPEAYWQPDVGFGIYVDIDYNIGPAYYSFVPVHYLGERRLRHWIEPWQRNVEYMRITENRTRITYRSSENRMASIFNDGPDYAVYSRRTQNPIRRLTLAEQDDVDVAELRNRKANLRNTIQNDRFSVIAPTIQRVRDKEVKPTKVAHHFDRTKLDRGWERYREEEIRDLRTKFETDKREAKRDVNRESTTAERMPKASPADETPAGKRKSGEATTAERPTQTLPTDETPVGKRKPGEGATARSDAEELRKAVPVAPGRAEDQPPKGKPGRDTEEKKSGRTAEAEQLRKAIPVTPAPDIGEKPRTSRAEADQLRKAIPATPAPDGNEKSRKPSGEDQSRKAKTPGGSSERFRVEPQDAPPRSQTGPKPGVNKPEDNPPGPSRGIVPGESSNSQRKTVPDTDRAPKMKPDRGPQSDALTRALPQQRVQPTVPQPQPKPEVRKVEPRKIEPPPQAQAPKATPRVAPVGPTPPPEVIQRPPDGGKKPDKTPPPGQNPDDDEKKKKPR